MIAFLSPAKTLDFESDLKIGEVSEPYFLEAAEKVNKKLSRYTIAELEKLQSISHNLAAENYSRNQQWSIEDHNDGKQAALAFKGDVYQGMQADNWNERDMDFAQKHIRILSGLYGVLRPGDKILPYRLEMGTKIPVARRKDLYEFWKDKLPHHFQDEIPAEEIVLNLASNEYFKALEKAGVSNKILNVEFKDYSKGDFKVIAFYAKKARGMMASFLVKNKISEPGQLKAFDTEGYYFDAKSSSENNYVFLRDNQQS